MYCKTLLKIYVLINTNSYKKIYIYIPTLISFYGPVCNKLLYDFKKVWGFFFGLTKNKLNESRFPILYNFYNLKNSQNS